MADISTLMGSLWNRYINLETLFAILMTIALYQFVIKNEAFYEFVNRLLIKLELRITGNYDHVPIDGESIVSGYKTKVSWELVKDNVGVFAVQGRRPHMEDRFNVVSNLENTGTSIFGIFDGHGGDFAADFVEKTLFKSIMIRLLKSEINNRQCTNNIGDNNIINNEQQSVKLVKNYQDAHHEKESTISEDILTANYEIKNIDNNINGDGKTVNNINNKINNVNNNLNIACVETPVSVLNWSPKKVKTKNKKLRSIMKEEILSVDKQLLEIEKKTGEISGSTLLLAMVHNDSLIVANVGDSRGVLCDANDKVIPLSFDHKPQIAAEKKRIKQAGGFVTFNGVWRVAGILALSRAMGDYPLKEKNFVVAEPDILTFNLKKIKPKFMILATDGLWDVFSNEEAIHYISDRLHEPHFGAKSLVLQAYYRGSLDNISVMVIKFSYDNSEDCAGDCEDDEEEEEESDGVDDVVDGDGSSSYDSGDGVKGKTVIYGADGGRSVNGNDEVGDLKESQVLNNHKSIESSLLNNDDDDDDERYHISSDKVLFSLPKNDDDGDDNDDFFDPNNTIIEGDEEGNSNKTSAAVVVTGVNLKPADSRAKSSHFNSGEKLKLDEKKVSNQKKNFAQKAVNVINKNNDDDNDDDDDSYDNDDDKHNNESVDDNNNDRDKRIRLKIVKKHNNKVSAESSKSDGKKGVDYNDEKKGVDDDVEKRGAHDDDEKIDDGDDDNDVSSVLQFVPDDYDKQSIK